MSNKNSTRPGTKSLNINRQRSNSSDTQININEMELTDASRKIADRASINKEVMLLVPELKQAKDVITNSIISPNDYSKKELISDFDNYLDLPEIMVSKIKDIIDTTVTKYKLVDELGEVVKVALFEDGAYPEIIIPRSKITEIITSDTDLAITSKKDLEDFKMNTYSTKLEKYGYVTINTSKKISIDKETYSLESLGLTSSSNPYLLTTPEIYDEARKNILSRDLSLPLDVSKDLESIDKNVLSTYEVYKRRNKERFISISRDTKLKAEDLPFRIRVSSSAILPIYTDDRTEHLGYFVLADEMNRPITKKVNDDELHNLYKSSNDSNTVLKSVLNNASRSFDKNKDSSVIISNMMDIAGRILMSSIDDAISTSIYKSNYNLDYENSLLKILLARALEEKQTKLIFVPVEYVSYIAFDYRDNGTGKTIIEDITLLASFKAMLLLSQIYASVTSNIPVTDAVVDIDENDPNPMKTKETMEQLILSGGRKRILWGETSIEGLGNWIQNQGMRITYNHKTFPDTKITMDTKNKEISYTPNTDVMESISGYMLRHMGLSPTILDDANQAEFASVAMINNALSNKVNNERQDVLNAGESDKVRKLVKADNTLLNRVVELVKSSESKLLSIINKSIEDGNKLERIDDSLKVQIAIDIIEGMKVRVPRAESKDRDELREKFSNYMETIDTALEHMKDSSFIEDVSSELGITTDNILGNIKLIAMVDWCEEHNYARGLTKLLEIRDKAELKTMIDRITAKDSNMIALAEAISIAKTKILESIKPKDEDNNADENGVVEPTEEGNEETPDGDTVEIDETGASEEINTEEVEDNTESEETAVENTESEETVEEVEEPIEEK